MTNDRKIRGATSAVPETKRSKISFKGTDAPIKEPAPPPRKRESGLKKIAAAMRGLVTPEPKPEQTEEQRRRSILAESDHFDNYIRADGRSTYLIRGDDGLYSPTSAPPQPQGTREGDIRLSPFGERYIWRGSQWMLIGPNVPLPPITAMRGPDGPAQGVIAGLGVGNDGTISVSLETSRSVDLAADEIIRSMSRAQLGGIITQVQDGRITPNRIVANHITPATVPMTETEIWNERMRNFVRRSYNPEISTLRRAHRLIDDQGRSSALLEIANRRNRGGRLVLTNVDMGHELQGWPTNDLATDLARLKREALCVFYGIPLQDRDPEDYSNFDY